MKSLAAELAGEMREHWLVVITCLMCPWALQLMTHVLPFIYPKIIDEYGWSREQTTLIASLRYIFGTVGALAMGYLAERISPWILLIVATLVTGLAQIWFLAMDSLVEYYVIGILQGIFGPGGYAAVMIILARFFVKSLGTVTGIVPIGASLCSIIAPPLITYVMEIWSWRWGVTTMTIGIWFVVLPLLLLSFTLSRSSSASREQKPSLIEIHEADQTSLFRSRDFVFMAIAISFASMADAGFRHHQVLIFRDLNVDASTIALIVSSIGAVGIITRVLAGALLDRMSSKGLGMLYLFEALASLLALILFIPEVVPLYVVLRAFSHAAITLDQSVVARHLFGTHALGKLIGIFAAIGSLGSAAGPWLMGVIFDTSGSYHNAFILFSLLPVLGALFAWATKPHYWLRQKSGP